MPRLLERINFPKIVTVLAITFGIALGACGLTAVAGMKVPGLAALGILEMAVMIVSAFGLVVMAILWVIASLLGQTRSKSPEVQNLFDNPPNSSEKNDNK